MFHSIIATESMTGFVAPPSLMCTMSHPFVIICDREEIMKWAKIRANG